MPKKVDSNKPEFKLERTEDFVSRYANHARFEPTVFDIKILFGQTDVSKAPLETIFQHTAITVPWAEVKLLLYYLTIQLIFQEADNGPVLVPANQVPPPIPSLPSHLRGNEVAERAYDIATKHRDSFIAMMSKPVGSTE